MLTKGFRHPQSISEKKINVVSNHHRRTEKKNRTDSVAVTRPTERSLISTRLVTSSKTRWKIRGSWAVLGYIYVSLAPDMMMLKCEGEVWGTKITVLLKVRGPEHENSKDGSC